LNRLRRALPMLVCAVAGVGVWAVFRPALMSPDSLDQYAQARAGEYNDWHPPIMAVALRGVLALGGDIGALMLVQALAGVLGAWALMRELMRVVQMPGDAARDWLAAGLTLLLLTPLTPLAFYLMTFWKDSWLAVLLVWIGALACRLFTDRNSARSAALAARAALLIALGGAAALVRHNAVAVLPAIGLLLIVLLWPRLRGWALPAALLPVAFALVADTLIDRAFAVRHTHAGNQVLALELVGLCVLKPEYLDELPYTRSCLIDPEYAEHYVWGAVVPLAWSKQKIVRAEFMAAGENPRLRREYWAAVRRHPLDILRVKLRGIRTLMGDQVTAYWFHDKLDPNKFGLVTNAYFHDVREAFTGAAWRVGYSRLRWISGAHVVWLGLNLVLLIGALRGLRRADGRFLTPLMLVPLSYYLSYLLATPSHDFRFMYPATLFVQCMLLASATALFVHLNDRAQSRAADQNAKRKRARTGAGARSRFAF
jgi:hypothetical protein